MLLAAGLCIGRFRVVEMGGGRHVDMVEGLGRLFFELNLHI